jgi:hypothetical protein
MAPFELKGQFTAPEKPRTPTGLEIRSLYKLLSERGLLLRRSWSLVGWNNWERLEELEEISIAYESTCKNAVWIQYSVGLLTLRGEVVGAYASYYMRDDELGESISRKYVVAFRPLRATKRIHRESVEEHGNPPFTHKETVVREKAEHVELPVVEVEGIMRKIADHIPRLTPKGYELKWTC